MEMGRAADMDMWINRGTEHRKVKKGCNVDDYILKPGVG